MFTQSEHTSVNNAFALRGLLGLAELAAVLGRGADAARYCIRQRRPCFMRTMPQLCLTLTPKP